MSTIKVPFSRAEVFTHALSGAGRTLSARLQGRRLEEGRNDLGFDRDIVGYIAEAALAKHLDKYPSPKIGELDTNTGDLSGKIQCKSILWRDRSLIVRAHDPADFKYVLAYVNFKEIADERSPFYVELMGWIAGESAKVDQFWVDKNPLRNIHQAAYFVPVDRLNPMATL